MKKRKRNRPDDKMGRNAPNMRVYNKTRRPKKSHLHSSSISSCDEDEALVEARSWKDAIVRKALTIVGRDRVSHRGQGDDAGER